MINLRQQGTAILDRLNSSLEKIDRGSPSQHAIASINLLKSCIIELRDLVPHITNPNQEIFFFRQLWPAIYSKLFFHIKTYRLETNLTLLPKELQPSLISEELQATARWLRRHTEFCTYYYAGSPAIDQMFTRSYSHSRLFDDLALVIDPEFATLASYRAAWCDAYTNYKTYLEQATSRQQHPAQTNTLQELDLELNLTDAEIAELFLPLKKKKAITCQGKELEWSQIVSFVKFAFNKKLTNIYDTLRMIKRRKKSRTPLLNSLIHISEKEYEQPHKK